MTAQDEDGKSLQTVGGVVLGLTALIGFVFAQNVVGRVFAVVFAVGVGLLLVRGRRWLQHRSGQVSRFIARPGRLVSVVTGALCLIGVVGLVVSSLPLPAESSAARTSDSGAAVATSSGPATLTLVARAKNASLKQRSLRSTVEVALTDELEVEVTLTNRSQHSMAHPFLLQIALSDRGTSKSAVTFSVADLDATTARTIGNEVALDEDQCFDGLTLDRDSVVDARGRSGVFSASTQVATPDADSQDVPFGAIHVPALTPNEVRQIRFNATATRSGSEPFDALWQGGGRTLTIEAQDGSWVNERLVRSGDLVRVRVHVSMTSCTPVSQTISPLITATSAASSRQGVTDLRIAVAEDGNARPVSLDQVELVSQDGKRPRYSLVPGTTKAYGYVGGELCGRPTGAQARPDLVTTSGVYLGPIAGYEPRDTCVEHLDRGLQFSLRVL